MKELIKRQIALELKHSKRNQVELMKVFLRDFDNLIQEAATNLELHAHMFDDFEYQTKLGEVKVREDLKEVYSHLRQCNVSELMYKLLTTVVGRNQVTLQQGVGSVIGSFSGISTTSRQLKAVNLVIEYCPLIEVEIHKGEEFSYLHSLIELEPEELEALNVQSVSLPSVVPLKRLRNNSSIGYRTFKKSVLMGGKHHDKDICLPHLNKRNRVAFKLDKEIAGQVLAGKLGAFDATPKYNKKTAKTETKNEVQERKNEWLALHADMAEKLHAIGDVPFYFAHRRDNRGRTYVEAYHLNYQGRDYQKAMVDFAKVIVIEPEF
ncbi:hypothetical protein NVP1238A_86 [Vibrio phage 1.238.A._10N.261.52.F10]|uniref:Uncharacterized protein n=2 Tax=Pariacacavirus TaxID=2948856 RepID=A0A2I7RUL2_9CAUD|nr:hypothetical protein KNT79_gp86 [Vibrio phage 1.238.A._10N.261.52.F10]YP_010093529.1 hypothetical protein KNT80_gp86 [Vibrio phage 1.245.O._10N.261.54.C7]AUR97335.1 hypothetical protein NVP1238A_86 [Vibrio phage 1.238.A._10N.261.52.F10]AUR97429.1 hypothetical protein NVP1238B_87 [Vibrio phage 1.238.B._10N.261.52.F10]AUR97999.1 hypothetical protein NVP1245O_86 [Vibrio phage 1.245.O._10N.261.54.C7]